MQIRARDGFILRGELLHPSAAGPARVVVALSHAMMVDRRTLDRESGLLSQLLAAGALVLWFDQRGHGQSLPTPAAGACWDYDDLVHDTGTVAAYLADRFPALPRVAVGHSLFGHVALAHQARASKQQGADPLVAFDALALIGANVWLKDLEPERWRYWLKRAGFAAALAASRPLGYLPVRRLGIGSDDESYPYFAQMARWLPDNDWTARDGFSYLQALSSVSVPLLSVAGAGDRLLAVPGCQLRLVSKTRGPVTHLTVGRRFGYASDPDHMGLVLDPRLWPLWREIAVWVCGCAISRG